MIKWDNKEPIRIEWQGKNIVAVYAYMHYVWQAFSSCYSSGAWIGTLPWRSGDPWKGI